GFTLLGVLAALAIAATGLLAGSRTVTSSLDVSIATEARTVAYWVAGNELAELRISGAFPGVGSNRSEVSMAGRNWAVERETKATPDPDVLRVEVRVFEQGTQSRALARLNGYLVRFESARDVPGGGGLGSNGVGVQIDGAT
ncbi:MAG: type II secretion system protein GspI, partial [Proteobacteria bacterium]